LVPKLPQTGTAPLGKNGFYSAKLIAKFLFSPKVQGRATMQHQGSVPVGKSHNSMNASKL